MGGGTSCISAPTCRGAEPGTGHGPPVLTLTWLLPLLLFLTELRHKRRSLGVTKTPAGGDGGGCQTQRRAGQGFGTQPSVVSGPRLGGTGAGGAEHPPASCQHCEYTAPSLGGGVGGGRRVLSRLSVSPHPGRRGERAEECPSRAGPRCSRLDAELAHPLPEVEGELEHGGSQALVDQVPGQVTLRGQRDKEGA